MWNGWHISTWYPWYASMGQRYHSPFGWHDQLETLRHSVHNLHCDCQKGTCNMQNVNPKPSICQCSCLHVCGKGDPKNHQGFWFALLHLLVCLNPSKLFRIYDISPISYTLPLPVFPGKTSSWNTSTSAQKHQSDSHSQSTMATMNIKYLSHDLELYVCVPWPLEFGFTRTWSMWGKLQFLSVQSISY